MKAVIYARYSSDNQREESIEGQLRECKEYADKNGITILCSYIDRALSAKTDNRPEFQKMVQDSAKGLFDTVLVWKLDRFARNRYDSAHYKAVLRRNGVKVVSATENISDGPEGIILESMLEGMAEYYSAELAQKINRGLTENALKGKNNGGGIPLGYQLTDDQHLRIDPLTAPIVREIYQRYAEGETVRSIITSLNERHILTQKQKPFRPNSLHSVLCNRKYIGEYRYKDIIIPDGVPSIIPKDLFERVQMRVEKNKRTPARAKAEEEYLLTTKLFCGHCGRMMIGESGKSHTGAIYRYYKCSGAKRKLGCRKKAVKKDWIECIAVQYTIQRVFQDELIAQIADKLVELQNTEDNTLPLLRKQLADTNRGIENMLNAIQQGILTNSTKERLEELEKLREELKASILQAELESVPNTAGRTLSSGSAGSNTATQATRTTSGRSSISFSTASMYLTTRLVFHLQLQKRNPNSVVGGRFCGFRFGFEVLYSTMKHRNFDTKRIRIAVLSFSINNRTTPNILWGGRENRLPFFHSCGERFARRGYFLTVRRPGSGGHWGRGRGYNVGREHGLEAVL